MLSDKDADDPQWNSFIINFEKVECVTNPWQEKWQFLRKYISPNFSSFNSVLVLGKLHELARNGPRLNIYNLLTKLQPLCSSHFFKLNPSSRSTAPSGSIVKIWTTSSSESASGIFTFFTCCVTDGLQMKPGDVCVRNVNCTGFGTDDVQGENLPLSSRDPKTDFQAFIHSQVIAVKDKFHETQWRFTILRPFYISYSIQAIPIHLFIWNKFQLGEALP